MSHNGLLFEESTGKVESTVPNHRQVCDLWQAHHGWKRWPKERRFDAVLIMRWVNVKAYPLSFWRVAIKQVPQDAFFQYLTTPPLPGQTGRLEQWFAKWKEAERPDSIEERRATMRSFAKLMAPRD